MSLVHKVSSITHNYSTLCSTCNYVLLESALSQGTPVKQKLKQLEGSNTCLGAGAEGVGPDGVPQRGVGRSIGCTRARWGQLQSCAVTW